MLFYVEKCKIMHIGYNNRRVKYEMGEVGGGNRGAGFGSNNSE
jgi:hypothetical protein